MMGTVDRIMKLTIIFLIYFSQSTQAKLILLSVIFRHGDRAPERSETYPNDPHVNETFYPYGAGGLTNMGKEREYQIGQHLRDRYGYFLGDTYLSDEVKARSTGLDRTKTSLHLVLAGVYPPVEEQQWNPMLIWQPIPTEYVSTLDDTLMVPQQCPSYLKVREDLERSTEFKNKMSRYQSLMKTLTEYTGKNISSTVDMASLYHGLMAERSLNLELPDWTYGIFPYGGLYDGTVLEYEFASYNDEMKRLNGGMLLRKITDDMTDACAGKLDPPRKLFLYGGHELNIAAVLQALHVYKPHVPRYSSAVIFELHENENDKNHFVRVRYYVGFTIPGRKEFLDPVMQVPGCQKLCELGKFKEVLKNTIARDIDIPCDKRSLKSYLESGNSELPNAITEPLLANIKMEESLRYVLH